MRKTLFCLVAAVLAAPRSPSHTSVSGRANRRPPPRSGTPAPR